MLVWCSYLVWDLLWKEFSVTIIGSNFLFLLFQNFYHTKLAKTTHSFYKMFLFQIFFLMIQVSVTPFILIVRCFSSLFGAIANWPFLRLCSNRWQIVLIFHFHKTKIITDSPILLGFVGFLSSSFTLEYLCGRDWVVYHFNII